MWRSTARRRSTRWGEEEHHLEEEHHVDWHLEWRQAEEDSPSSLCLQIKPKLLPGAPPTQQLHWPHLIFSFVTGQTNLVSVSWIMNNAAMSMGVQIALLDPIFISCGYVCRMALLDPMLALFFTFGEASMLFSRVAGPV